MPVSKKKYKILATWPPMATEAISLLEAKASVSVTPAAPKPEQIAKMASEKSVHGIIVRQGKITKEVLNASPNLKIISKHGVGIDNIDIEAASEMGIPVCITPNANYNSVAEHAFAMMFALAKNIGLHNRRIREGVWDKTSNRGIEIYGKCLGIIGVGRIGKRLSEIAKPHKMKILGFDPLLSKDIFPAEIEAVDTLEELISEADFISIHCPKTPDTIGMIGENEFKLMKPIAILINTARSGIVDESDLIQALESGSLGGAGIDCFETEPLVNDSPFLAIKDKLIMTPHIGAVTEEALVRMGTEAVENIISYLDGEKLSSDVVVNPEFRAG
jgi:D-3-phosphoglycerate dehydrogenase